jgi:hypothetical protein
MKLVGDASRQAAPVRQSKAFFSRQISCTKGSVTQYIPWPLRMMRLAASTYAGMQVRWSTAALGDLARLHAFLAPVNPRAAKAVLERLKQAPRVLQTQP